MFEPLDGLCGSGFTRECIGGFNDAFAGKPAPTEAVLCSEFY